MTVLTVLSASVMVQACAGTGSESELELEELEQQLDEADAGDGGSEGGTLAGLGGLVGGPGGLFGGSTGGGILAGLDAGGVFGGTIADSGSVDASFPEAGPVDAGPRQDGGVNPPDGGPGFPGGPGFGPVPFANWKFDDCGPSSSLLDSSPSQAHAQRSAQVACAVGLSGGAVIFDNKKDTIVASARPAFNLSNRVAMAAWIHPTNVQQGSVLTKALNGTTAFELVLNNGNLIFRINIDNGRKIKQLVSKAPISANRWTHVAALYDGSFVRLFEDGVQVGQIAASGIIADVAGPIEIGNNQAQTFLRGRIDEVWLSTDPVTPDDIVAMSCIRNPSTLVATPTSSGPQEVGTSFTYDFTFTNRDVGACQPKQAFVSSFGGDIPGIVTSTFPGNVQAAPGSSAHFSLQVTSSTDAEPGSILIPVNLFTFGGTFENLTAQVEYILKEPTGCFVRTGRELMLRDLSVVEDRLRTTFDGPADDPRTGVWTFGRLMEQLAASDAEGPDLAQHLFNSWLTDQTINGFTVPAKPSMRDLVLNSWPRTANGKLDLKRAPLRLLTIVNRIDSRNLAQGHAGEGRFVFGVLDPQGFQTEFTVIFEFRLPAKTPADVLAWANRWHALGALPFPSEEYNAALQAITDSFSRRGSEPGRPNDSALAQFRSNEIALTNNLWELREFELSGTTHLLEPATVKLTPDTGFIQGSPLVADFINRNEASILLEQHTVPETFNGERFLGGSSFNNLIAWTAPGINNNEARHKFSLNTCNGCHASEENGTAFLQVFPRNLGEVSSLSGFLQGITLADPVTGAPRQLNDLARRNNDLKQLVCEAPAPTARTAASASGSSAREAFIAKGIGRTH